MIGFAVAIRFQLLPEVVDLSLIPTLSGVGGMLGALGGAVARFDPERLVVFGNLVGAVVGAIVLLAGIAGVLS